MAQKVSDISSAALAFLGDSVFELNVRSRIVSECGENVGKLNKRSKALTNAKCQALMIEKIQELLSEEEMAVYKRGRNFKSINAPKSCSISEYRRATGLEALFGYLFLQGQQDRIAELIDAAIASITEIKD